MYAINSTNDGFRSINSQADMLPGEVFSATLPVITPSIQRARAAASVAIDAAAGIARAKYITITSGQSETYMAKAADAAAYKAVGYPFAGISNYPWVQAEAQAINGTTAITAAQAQAACDGILAGKAAADPVLIQIEQARRAGGVAVAAATTVAAVQAAQDAAVAALGAI